MTMVKYFYISERKMYFYLIHLVGLGYERVIPKFEKWFRTPLDMILVCRNDTEEFWYGNKRSQYRRVTDYYSNNPEEVQNFADAYEKEFKKITKQIISRKEKIHELSPGQIYSDLNELFTLVRVNFQMVSIARRLDVDLLPKFKMEVQKYFNLSSEKIDSLLAELVKSPLPSYATEEKRIFYESLRNLKKPYKKSSLENLFKNHLERHEWVSLSYYDEPKLSVKDLKNRLKERFELKEKKTKNFKLPASLKKQERCLSNAVYLKDYARSKIAHLIWIMEYYFDGIARRCNIPKKEIKTYTNNELKDLLLKNKRMSQKVIKERRALCVLLKGKIHTGKQAEILISRYHLSIKVDQNERIFKGRVACKGYAIGFALVPKSLENLKKSRSKTILVVPNTNPAYVPFLKKVKGIIAEEGGMTAHVSLISREFNIPAIVGVNHATKILKDGNLVEVDANNGVVKLLKK